MLHSTALTMRYAIDRRGRHVRGPTMTTHAVCANARRRARIRCTHVRLLRLPEHSAVIPLRGPRAMWPRCWRIIRLLISMPDPWILADWEAAQSVRETCACTPAIMPASGSCARTAVRSSSAARRSAASHVHHSIR